MKDTRAAQPAERTKRGWSFLLQTTLASLAYRDFRYLWLGQITHSFALWLEQTARPLLVLAITGSAVHLGGVIFVRTIPAVLLGILAGVVADRFNRRAVLLATKSIVLGLSIAFAVLLVADMIRIWHIYAFGFLRGATMAFDQPARRALISTVVPRPLVINAMAVSSGSMGAMRIAGAASAGLLMGFIGIEAPFVTIAVVYVGAVVFTWVLRPIDHERRSRHGIRSVGSDLVEGLRFAWRTPAVRGVVIIAMGYFTFGMAFMQVFAPLVATMVLDIGETGFGLMVSVLGIGSVLGSLVLATTSPGRGRGKLMLGLLIIFGLLLIMFSATSYTNSVALVFIVVVLLGIGQSGFMPLINTLLMEAAPVDMRGRVMGLVSLDRAMAALGGFLAGVLSAAVGAQLAQIVFGAGCIATAVVMLVAYPPLRKIE